MKKLFALIFIFFMHATEAKVALVCLQCNPQVRIAFVTNLSVADCKLTQNDFTSYAPSESIRAAKVDFSYAQKRVAIISNHMNADSPSCLFR